MGSIIDFYPSYDQFLIAGDVNMQEEINIDLDDFLDEFHAKNLVKEPTYVVYVVYAIPYL